MSVSTRGIAESDGFAREVSDLERFWTFEAEPLTIACHLRYWRRSLGAVAFPPYAELKAVSPRAKWCLFFVYGPKGVLDESQLFSLRRLRGRGFGVLVVLASPRPDQVPAEIFELCDALFWKALEGYDFSAYAIGLHAIAAQSPGADVLVMNDSVFGPFFDLEPFFDGARWDLTGFTASSGGQQRHIQSYAFLLKSVTAQRLGQFGKVFSLGFAFNTPYGAISCKELWMARIASRSMSVGSFWFSDIAHMEDPSLERSLELINAGFPFLKKSLLTKHSGFQSKAEVVQRLEQLGHPLP